MYVDKTDSHTRYVNILKAFIAAKSELGKNSPQIEFDGFSGVGSLEELLKDVIECEETLPSDEYVQVDIGECDTRIYNTEGFPLQIILNRGFISYHEDFYQSLIKSMSSPLVIEDRDDIKLKNYNTK